MARYRTLLPLVVGLTLAAAPGCDLSDEPSAASGTDTTADGVALVKRFMQTRQQGLAADDFLSADALVAYEEHAGGLWLYDDTLPGGPGGEYARFSVEEGEPGEVEVRIEVVWDGDAEPTEMVERLTIESGKIVEARRTDDLADDGLPLPVAKTREQIYRAAVAHDYDTLRSLVDPATFNYSLGEEGDPIGYWRRQEESEVPIVGDILPHLIHTRFGRYQDIYWWPSATSKPSAEWTEADIESMRDAGYRDRDIRAFEEAIGGYAGWRAGIRVDGTWVTFISGE
jgi:hypothetical protein